jgi:NitT/TauT family transport system substrate-binding protein
LIVNIAVNKYNFQWAFPEMVADRLGLFARQGLEAIWSDATPAVVTNKAAMYTELLMSKKTDIYHAGEWVCILRVLDSKGSKIVSKSLPGPGTLNSTFSLYVRKGSGYTSPADLKDKPIAIEVGTGSYYTALQDLERYMPKESIRLVQVGEPHRRFLSLVNKEVEAASLLSPWTDLAITASLVELLRTFRSNPTTSVAREDDDPDKLRRVFVAVNEAIDKMNASPADFREMYFQKAQETLRDTPANVRQMAQGLRDTLVVPKWNHWVAYAREDFEKTYRWMVDQKLAPSGHTYREVVASNTSEIFG